MSKAVKNKCWIWPGSTSTAGYGQIVVRREGKVFHIAAHRTVWEAAYGPIPPKMEVMHRCDNPPCIRPGHLRLGTHLENMQDMYAKGRRIAHNTLKTHCKHGHQFTVDNTYVRPDGHRACKNCQNRANKGYRVSVADPLSIIPTDL